MGEIKCWVSKDGTAETEEDYARLWRIWLVADAILWLIAFLIQTLGVVVYCKFKDDEAVRQILSLCLYIFYFINLALIVVWTVVFGSMLMFSDAG